MEMIYSESTIDISVMMNSQSMIGISVMGYLVIGTLEMVDSMIGKMKMLDSELTIGLSDTEFMLIILSVMMDLESMIGI